MVRIIIGGVLGAVVMYAWGMAAWMVLPLHTPTLHSLEDEEAVRTALKSQNPKPGYYIIPSHGDWDEMVKKHKEGPVVSIIYSKGSEPMGPSVMAGGIAINIVSALIAAFLLSAATCCGNYLQRVGFVFGLGLFAVVVSFVALWNWMGFPLDFTLGMVADLVIGWTIAGLVMAAIIRPKATASPVQ